MMKFRMVVLAAVVGAIIGISVPVHAQQDIPADYGAAGALKDTDISIEEALTYAIQDEFLAQARYDAVISKFGQRRPFTNIKAAEQRHIEALIRLFRKYGIQVPVDDAKQYVSEPDTLNEAFQAGIGGEITNISMYEKLAGLPDLPTDIKAVMGNLSMASRQHLAAFRMGLEQL
ncbi:ferritin-like domain-containing protein [Bacillus marinisedimentorum]|uniref:ferritin-like domain-containing protein n=1 Tax=Bacillus marinisedimentorum TaxID=1821260 RepID=UPI000AC0911B|nr:DUF2202 domain-containing protein [Bacillus marinisedimentorum]